MIKHQTDIKRLYESMYTDNQICEHDEHGGSHDLFKIRKFKEFDGFKSATLAKELMGKRNPEKRIIWGRFIEKIGLKETLNFPDRNDVKFSTIISNGRVLGVGTYHPSGSGSTFKVGIFFDEDSLTKDDFNAVVKMYLSKYCAPAKIEEFFLKKLHSGTEYSKMIIDSILIKRLSDKEVPIRVFKKLAKVSATPTVEYLHVALSKTFFSEKHSFSEEKITKFKKLLKEVLDGK